MEINALRLSPGCGLNRISPARLSYGNAGERGCFSEQGDGSLLNFTYSAAAICNSPRIGVLPAPPRPVRPRWSSIADRSFMAFFAFLDLGTSSPGICCFVCLGLVCSSTANAKTFSQCCYRTVAAVQHRENIPVTLRDRFVLAEQMFQICPQQTSAGDGLLWRRFFWLRFFYANPSTCI